METARLNLQYATIRAPIGGLAGSLQIREGNLVRGPGNTLVTINQIRPILVRFPVPAQQLPENPRPSDQGRRSLAQPAGGVPGSKAGWSSWTMRWIATTGTILLKGSFDNADGTLWPGQFVSVSVQLYVQKDALAIPAVAVLTGQQGTSVFVVDSAQTVAPRTVKVARTGRRHRGDRKRSPGRRTSRHRRAATPGARRPCRDQDSAGARSGGSVVNIAEPFIRRPVMTTLVSAGVLIFGDHRLPAVCR